MKVVRKETGCPASTIQYYQSLGLLKETVKTGPNFDALVHHVKSICKNFQSEYISAVLRPSSYALAMEDFYPEHVPAIKQAI